VGERIVTSPDAPVGVGAVGKICEVNGSPSMKLNRGSGKATLPGRVQVFRHQGIDTVACLGETLPGTPLLMPVWTERGPEPLPSPVDVRAYAAECIAALAPSARQARQVNVPISQALYDLIKQLVAHR
jgi:hypothetical protein